MTSRDQDCVNNDLGEDLHRNFNELCVQNQLKGRFMVRASQNRLKLLKVKKQTSKRISNNIICSILRYIKTTPKRIKEGPEFIDEIRRHLYFLYEYNCSFFKHKKKYPYTRHLATLLEQYVALEYEALYTTRNDNIKYESVVEKRIMCLLQYMCRDPNSEDIRPFEASIRVLRILNRMGDQYKDDDKLIGKMMKKLSKKLGIQNAIDQVKEAQMSVLDVQSNSLFHLLMEDNYDSSSYEDDEAESENVPQMSDKNKTAEEEDIPRPTAMVKEEKVKFERPVLTIELNESDGEDVWMEYLTEETKSNKRDSIISSRLFIKDCMDIKKDLKSACKNNLSVHSGDSFKSKSTNVNKSYFEYLNSFARDTVIKSDEENYRCCGLPPCSTNFPVNNDVVMVLDNEEDEEPKNCDWKEERLRPLDNDCFIISSDEEVEEMGQKKIAQLGKRLEFATSKTLQINELKKDNVAVSENKQTNQCNNLILPVSKKVYINQQPRLLEFENEAPATSEEGEIIKGSITLRNIKELTRHSLTLNNSVNSEPTNIQTLKDDPQQEINEEVLLNKYLFEENLYSTELTEEELLLEEETESPDKPEAESSIRVETSCNSDSSQLASISVSQTFQKFQFNSSLIQPEKSEKAKETKLECCNLDNELLRLQVDYESDEASSKSSNSAKSLKQTTINSTEKKSPSLKEQLNTNLKSLETKAETTIPEKTIPPVESESRNPDAQLKVQTKSALNNVHLLSKNQTSVNKNNTKTCKTSKVPETSSNIEINKINLELSTSNLPKKSSPSKTNSEERKKKSLIWEKIKYAVQNYECVELDSFTLIEECLKNDPNYTECLKTRDFQNKIVDNFTVHDGVETVISHFDEPNLVVEENSPEIPSPFFEAIEKEQLNFHIVEETIEIEHLGAQIASEKEVFDEDESLVLIGNKSPMTLQYGNIESEIQNEEHVSKMENEQDFQVQTESAKERIEISSNVAVVIEETIPKDDIQIFEGETARNCENIESVNNLEHMHEVVSNAEAFIEEIVPEVSYYEDIEEDTAQQIVYMEPSEVVEETIVDIEENVQSVSENLVLNEICDQDEKTECAISVLEPINEIVINDFINEDIEDEPEESVNQHVLNVSNLSPSKNGKCYILDEIIAVRTEIEITSTEKIIKESMPTEIPSCSFEVIQKPHANFSQEEIVDIVINEPHIDFKQLPREKNVQKPHADFNVFKEMLTEKEVDVDIQKPYTNFKAFNDKLSRKKTVEIDIQIPSTSSEVFDELSSKEGKEIDVHKSHTRFKAFKEKLSRKKTVEVDIQKPSTSFEVCDEFSSEEETEIEVQKSHTRFKAYKEKLSRKKTVEVDTQKPSTSFEVFDEFSSEEETEIEVQKSHTQFKAFNEKPRKKIVEVDIQKPSTSFEVFNELPSEEETEINVQKSHTRFKTFKEKLPKKKKIIDIQKPSTSSEIFKEELPIEKEVDVSSLLVLADIAIQREENETKKKKYKVKRTRKPKKKAAKPRKIPLTTRKRKIHQVDPENKRITRSKELAVNSTPVEFKFTKDLNPKKIYPERLYDEFLTTSDDSNEGKLVIDEGLSDVVIEREEFVKVVANKDCNMVTISIPDDSQYKSETLSLLQDIEQLDLCVSSDNEDDVPLSQRIANIKKVKNTVKQSKSKENNNTIQLTKHTTDHSINALLTPTRNKTNTQKVDNNFNIKSESDIAESRKVVGGIVDELLNNLKLSSSVKNSPNSKCQEATSVMKTKASMKAYQPCTNSIEESQPSCSFSNTQIDGEYFRRKTRSQSSSKSHQMDATESNSQNVSPDSSVEAHLFDNEGEVDKNKKSHQKTRISTDENDNNGREKLHPQVSMEPIKFETEASTSNRDISHTEVVPNTFEIYKKDKRPRGRPRTKNLPIEISKKQKMHETSTINAFESTSHQSSKSPTKEQIDVEKKSTTDRIINKKDTVSNNFRNERHSDNSDESSRNNSSSRESNDKSKKQKTTKCESLKDKTKKSNKNSQLKFTEQPIPKNTFDFFNVKQKLSSDTSEAGPSRNSNYIPEEHEDQSTNDENSSNTDDLQSNTSPRNDFLAERLKVMEAFKLSQEVIKNKEIESAKETKPERVIDSSKYSKYNHSEIQNLFDQMLKKSPSSASSRQENLQTRTISTAKLRSKLASKTMEFLSKFKFCTPRHPINVRIPLSPRSLCLRSPRNERETNLFKKKFNNTTIITNDSFMNSKFDFTYNEDDNETNDENECFPSTSSFRWEEETQTNSSPESRNFEQKLCRNSKKVTFQELPVNEIMTRKRNNLQQDEISSDSEDEYIENRVLREQTEIRTNETDGRFENVGRKGKGKKNKSRPIPEESVSNRSCPRENLQDQKELKDSIAKRTSVNVEEAGPSGSLSREYLQEQNDLKENENETGLIEKEATQENGVNRLEALLQMENEELVSIGEKTEQIVDQEIEKENDSSANENESHHQIEKEEIIEDTNENKLVLKNVEVGEKTDEKKLNSNENELTSKKNEQESKKSEEFDSGIIQEDFTPKSPETNERLQELTNSQGLIENKRESKENERVNSESFKIIQVITLNSTTINKEPIEELMDFQEVLEHDEVEPKENEEVNSETSIILQEDFIINSAETNEEQIEQSYDSQVLLENDEMELKENEVTSESSKVMQEDVIIKSTEINEEQIEESKDFQYVIEDNELESKENEAINAESSQIMQENTTQNSTQINEEQIGDSMNSQDVIEIKELESKENEEISSKSFKIIQKSLIINLTKTDEEQIEDSNGCQDVLEDELELKENEEVNSESSKIVQEDLIIKSTKTNDEQIEESNDAQNVIQYVDLESKEYEEVSSENSKFTQDGLTMNSTEANKEQIEESKDSQYVLDDDELESKENEEVNSESSKLTQKGLLIKSTKTNEEQIEELNDSQDLFEDELESKENEEVNSEPSKLTQEGLLINSANTIEEFNDFQNVFKDDELELNENEEVSSKTSNVVQKVLTINSTKTNEEQVEESKDCQDVFEDNELELKENEEVNSESSIGTQKGLIINSTKTNEEQVKESKNSQDVFEDGVLTVKENEEVSSGSFNVTQEGLIINSTKTNKEQVEESKDSQNVLEDNKLELKENEENCSESYKVLEDDLIINLTKINEEQIEELNDSQNDDELGLKENKEVSSESSKIIQEGFITKSTKINELIEGSNNSQDLLEDDELRSKENEESSKIVKEVFITKSTKINEDTIEASNDSQDVLVDDKLELKQNEEVSSVPSNILEEGFIMNSIETTEEKDLTVKSTKTNEERIEGLVEGTVLEAKETGEEKEIIKTQENEIKTKEFEVGEENTSTPIISAQFANEIPVRNDGCKGRKKKPKKLIEDQKRPQLEMAVKEKQEKTKFERRIEEGEELIDTNIRKPLEEICTEVEKESEEYKGNEVNLEVLSTIVEVRIETCARQETNLPEVNDCVNIETNIEKKNGSKTPLRKRKMVLHFDSPKRKQHKTIDMVISSLKNKDRNLIRSIEKEDFCENLLVCEIKKRLQLVRSDTDTTISEETNVFGSSSNLSVDSEIDEETVSTQITDHIVPKDSQEIKTNDSIDTTNEMNIDFAEENKTGEVYVVEKDLFNSSGTVDDSMETNKDLDERNEVEHETNTIADETKENEDAANTAIENTNEVVDEANMVIDETNTVLEEANENMDETNEDTREIKENVGETKLATSAVCIASVEASHDVINLEESSFLEPEENNRTNILELEESQTSTKKDISEIGTVPEETKKNSQIEAIPLETSSNLNSSDIETPKEVNMEQQMQVSVDDPESDPIFPTKSEANEMFSCVKVSKELPSQILDYQTNVEPEGSYSNFEESASSKSESSQKTTENLVPDHFNMPSTSAFNFVSPTSLEIISSDEPIGFMQTSMSGRKKSSEGDTEKNKKLTYLRIGSETTDHNYYSPGGPLLGGKYDNELNKSNSSSLGHLKENELANSETDLDNSPVDSETMFSVPGQFDISILDDNVVEISDGLDDQSVDVHNGYELSETVGQLNFPLITDSLESTSTRDMNARLIDKNCNDSMQLLQDYIKQEVNDLDHSNDEDVPRNFQTSVRQLGAASTNIPWCALESLANWGFDDMVGTDPDEAGNRRSRTKSESRTTLLATPANMNNDSFIIGPGIGPHKNLSFAAMWNYTQSKSELMKRPCYDARVNAAMRYTPSRFSPPKKKTKNKKRLRNKPKEVDTKMAISVYNRSKSANQNMKKLKNELTDELEINTKRRNERTPVSAPKKRPPETKTSETPPLEKPSPATSTSSSLSSVNSVKEVIVDDVAVEEIVTEEVIETVSKDLKKQKIPDESEIQKIPKPPEKEKPLESKNEEVYENKFDIIKRRQRLVTTNYAIERLLQNEDKNKRNKTEKPKPKEQPSPKLPEIENKKTRRRSPNEDSLHRLPPYKNSISNSLPSTSNTSASKIQKRKFNFSDSDSDDEEDNLIIKDKPESAEVLFDKLLNADNSNRLKNKTNDVKPQEDCKKLKLRTEELKYKANGNCKPKTENDYKNRDEYREADRKRKELDRNDKLIVLKKRRESLLNIRTPSPAYSNGSSVSQTDKYTRHKRRKEISYSDGGHYHYSQTDDKHIRRPVTFNGTRSSDYSYRNNDQRYSSKSLEYSSRHHDDSRSQRRSSIGSQSKQDWYSKSRTLSNTRLVNPRMNPNKPSDNSWWDKMRGLLPTQEVYFPAPPETPHDNK